MNTFAELQTALLSDINASTSSSLFPTATIKLALNRAYIKVGRLFRWPQLEDAKMTSTQSGIFYYDAPATWSPDSIWRLEVDDEQYGVYPDFSPMGFHDFLDWKDNPDNENSTDLKWAVQHTRYFFYPTPSVAGSNNICVWGQENVENLANDDDVTVFSYNMPECNEAVVLEAGAILKRKGEAGNDSAMLSGEGKQLAILAFDKIRQEQGKYEKAEPFFYVPDYYSNGTSEDKTGRF